MTIKKAIDYYGKDTIKDTIETDLTQYPTFNDCFAENFTDFEGNPYLMYYNEQEQALNSFQNSPTLDGYDTLADGILGAVRLIQLYEQDTTGKIYTDLGNIIEVSNMIAFIRAENIFYKALKKAKLNENTKITKKTATKFLKALKTI